MRRNVLPQKRQSPAVLSASEALGFAGGDEGDKSLATSFIETEAAIQQSIGSIQREGASKTHCVLCKSKIPKARQAALPGVETCVKCAKAQEDGTLNLDAHDDDTDDQSGRGNSRECVYEVGDQTEDSKTSHELERDLF
ncbi:MAG: hypothetical protein O3A80_05075 [bacterium]|nr:hypothetical protein [bacterium]